MYAAMECLAILAFVIALAILVFLAASLFVIVEAAVRTVAQWSRALVSRVATRLSERWQAFLPHASPADAGHDAHFTETTP